MIRIGAILFALFAAQLAGACGRSPERQTYALSGTVVSVDAGGGRMTIAHDEIPGYMPAMTMPFRVREDWVIQAVSPGATITADLVVEGRSSWIENVVVASPAAAPGAPSRVEGATEPVAGDPAPPFALTSHRNRPIALESLRGSAVVVTFIYSRCPLPDYCPLMTDRFAQIDRDVLADPRLRARVRLVSISIDPEYDTPAVLDAYARDFALVDGRVPDNWDFATGSRDAIRAVAGSYGLVYEGANDQIVHSLRTAVIGVDGRLLRVYRGNEWQAADVVADLRAALEQ